MSNKTVVLNVNGMSCGHCVKSIEGALSEAGVTGKVDLAAKTVTAQFDDTKHTEEKLIEIIEDQGYDVVK